MKVIHKLILAAVASSALITGSVQANDLLGSLKSAADSAGLNNAGGTSGSMPSLSSLLSGSDTALTSKNATNAAGVLDYCVKNNVLSESGAANIKDQLMSKLGIQGASATQNQDYKNGMAGLLQTGNGESVDLNNLGNGLAQVKDKVKQKACDVVLNQAKSLI